jgi:hypothetical protein
MIRYAVFKGLFFPKPGKLYVTGCLWALGEQQEKRILRHSQATVV